VFGMSVALDRACALDFSRPNSTYCSAFFGDTCDDHYNCSPLPAPCSTAAPDCSVSLNEHQTCSVVEGNAVSGLRIDEFM
jgi:hypothetical protein